MTTEDTLDKDTKGLDKDTKGLDKDTKETEYAVRPHHRLRRLDYSDRKNIKLRNKLNIAFILLAIIGIVLWYTLDDRTPATIILLIGVALKICEVCIRLFRK